MPAKRAYGMDQQFYPWSPIVTRPVLRWPDNARVALAVIVNLEHWDWEGARFRGLLARAEEDEVAARLDDSDLASTARQIRELDAAAA